jgi:hypothetical protein
MTDLRPSLRLRLLVDLGFLMAAAVMIVGLMTLVLVGADVREFIRPLVALWIGSLGVFVLFGRYLVGRIVLRPLERLSSEADRYADGDVSPSSPAWESRELAHLSERYRLMADGKMVRV